MMYVNLIMQHMNELRIPLIAKDPTLVVATSAHEIANSHSDSNGMTFSMK
jgi:hypothetical protein